MKKNTEHPVRFIRNNLGLTQKALALKIGLKQSQLSACENMKRNLSVRAAKRLLKLAEKHGFIYPLDFIFND